MTESTTLTVTKAVQWRERLLSMIPEEVPGAPPVIDFSRRRPPQSIYRRLLSQICAAFYEDDADATAALVDQVRDACLEKGFFQIIGHGVPEDLQSAMFEQSADFFSLPLEQKERYDKGKPTTSIDRGFSDKS